LRITPKSAGSIANHLSAQKTPVPPPPHPIIERQFRALSAGFDKYHPVMQVIVAALMIAVIFIVDVVTGPEVALSIFYLLPISMLAWHRGWGMARISVIVSGLAWIAADILAGNAYQFEATRYWNGLVRVGFFVIVAYTLSQLRRTMFEAQRLARTDSLTGAANSRSFLELAAIEVARQHRYKHPLSIAFFDCDNFKEVNDKFGHAAGDDLLQRIAMGVQSVLREVDVVARLGGDEFGILLPESDERAALTVCGKLRDALRLAVSDYNVTFSIGLVTFLSPPEDVNHMVHVADEAMYEAKHSGKNAARHRVIGAPNA
jgi:diguanylate cyclase (GGDEF)-like protein